MQIRQANSIRDIEALRDEIEKAGFRRIRDSREDFSDQSFTDKLVLDVVVRLRQLQQRQGAEFVGRRNWIDSSIVRHLVSSLFVGVLNSVGTIVSTPRIRRRKC